MNNEELRGRLFDSTEPVVNGGASTTAGGARKFIYCDCGAVDISAYDEVANALRLMLAAFSLETDFGVDASVKRLEAKKNARAALAKLK